MNLISKLKAQVVSHPFDLLAIVVASFAAYFAYQGNGKAGDANEAAQDAIVVTRAIATQQSYEAFVDTRISHCTSMSQTYASQSWSYGKTTDGLQIPDPDLADRSAKTIAIARAARLCRNADSEQLEDLKTCIETYVDNVRTHLVEEKSVSGNTYENLAC